MRARKKVQYSNGLAQVNSMEINWNSVLISVIASTLVVLLLILARAP